MSADWILRGRNRGYNAGTARLHTVAAAVEEIGAKASFSPATSEWSDLLNCSKWVNMIPVQSPGMIDELWTC